MQELRETLPLRLPPTTLAPVEAKGVNGTITLDGTLIRIQRRGFLARATVGKGEKTIPVRHLTAVQLKPAGPFTNGFIQFTLGGGTERRSTFGRQTQDAASDENSVVFTRGQQPAFDALRAAVEAALH